MVISKFGNVISAPAVGAIFFIRTGRGIRSQDWTAFLATFAPDAVMTFEGVPAGPCLGLDQITCAYAEQPP
jgi:hypothetical protein